jgi:hypothetical protein
VILEANPFPYTDNNFNNVANTNTANNGSYSFTRRPSSNSQYRVRRGNTMSPVATELVRLAVSLRLSDYTPRRGQVVRFSGRVCPQHDGQLARIQRRTSAGSYVTVRRTRQRDIPGSTCSRYSKLMRIFRDGRFRAVASSGDGDHVRGISRSRVANVP